MNCVIFLIRKFIELFIYNCLTIEYIANTIVFLHLHCFSANKVGGLMTHWCVKWWLQYYQIYGTTKLWQMHHIIDLLTSYCTPEGNWCYNFTHVCQSWEQLHTIPLWFPLFCPIFGLEKNFAFKIFQKNIFAFLVHWFIVKKYNNSKYNSNKYNNYNRYNKYNRYNRYNSYNQQVQQVQRVQQVHEVQVQQVRGCTHVCLFYMHIVSDISFFMPDTRIASVFLRLKIESCQRNIV